MSLGAIIGIIGSVWGDFLVNVQADGTWSKTDHLEGSMTVESVEYDIDFVMTLNSTHEDLLSIVMEVGMTIVDPE